jgi:hypothetical protein
MRTIALLTLLAAGCSKTSGGGGNHPPPPDGQDLGGAPTGPPITAALHLADSEASLAAGLYADSFNFYDMRTLLVQVVLPDMPRQTMLHLLFIDPRGGSFYEDHVPFTTDPSGGTLTHPIMKTPQLMMVARPFNSGWALNREVPIGGSSFVRFPQPGDWQVQATVDGVTDALSAPMHVVIER